MVLHTPCPVRLADRADLGRNRCLLSDSLYTVSSCTMGGISWWNMQENVQCAFKKWRILFSCVSIRSSLYYSQGGHVSPDLLAELFANVRNVIVCLWGLVRSVIVCLWDLMWIIMVCLGVWS